MNREELKQKILEHSNSMFPLIDFFNDIGRNKDPRYDKERAYEDIEKIYDVFIFYKEKCEKLEKENQELKEKFKISEENEEVVLTTLESAVQESLKLKKVIDILKDNLQLILTQDIDPFINEKVYAVEIKKCYKLYNGFEVTQEEYNLLKEVLKDEKRM